MNNNFKIIFLTFILFIILVPNCVEGYSITSWQKNLQAVAKTLESNNYVYDSYGGAPLMYKSISNSKKLTSIKSYNSWLKTSSGKKAAKKYTINNYKEGDYCKFYNYPCSETNLSKSGTNFSACKKCIVADCTNYCMYKSKLGYAKCMKKKSFNKKNKYFRDKYCKDIVNGSKRATSYANYRNKTAGNNANKLASKGIICHNYIMFALQKSGLYSASEFSVAGSRVSPGTCGGLNRSKFNILVPENSHEANCYTQRVSWLNNRPTLKSLAEQGYVKKGDIISQYDGSGQHSEVYIGYSGGRVTIYGVGSEYQVSGRKASSYGLSSDTKFLVKSKILSTQNDTRNNHNNPRVAMIIRIK